MPKIEWVEVCDVWMFVTGRYAGNVARGQDGKWKIAVFRECQSVTPYGGRRTYETLDIAKLNAEETVKADMIARGELENPPALDVSVSLKHELGVTVGSGSLLWCQFGAIHVALAGKSAAGPIVTFEVAPVACDPRGSAWSACCYAETDDRPKLQHDSYEAVDVETAKFICQKTWDDFCKPQVNPLDDHDWMKIGHRTFEKRNAGRSVVFWLDNYNRQWMAVVTLSTGVSTEFFGMHTSAEDVQKILDQIVENDLKSVATPA